MISWMSPSGTVADADITLDQTGVLELFETKSKAPVAITINSLSSAGNKGITLQATAYRFIDQPRPAVVLRAQSKDGKVLFFVAARRNRRWPGVTPAKRVVSAFADSKFRASIEALKDDQFTKLFFAKDLFFVK
jgi:hypothetical protein